MIVKIKPVPTAEELKTLLPLSDGLKKQRLDFVESIENILSGRDKRKLFIVGPCSADNVSAVCEYAERLARVARQIKSVAHVVMRAYTGKPRTRGDVYAGMIHTPDLETGITDISAGLFAARSLHLKVAQACGLFTADEIFYPSATAFTDDITAYLTVGARSAQDPLHRYVASGADVPVGVKNPLHGDVYDLADSVYSVGISNEFMLDGFQVRTGGNKYAHAVLRGAVDRRGNNIANYGYDCVMKYCEACAARNVDNGCVIIDAGHANSGKNISKVSGIVTDALDRCRASADYNRVVKGFMIESYIEDGCQPPRGGVYGKSVTDPCLGWKATEKLLLSAADKIVI